MNMKMKHYTVLNVFVSNKNLIYKTLYNSVYLFSLIDNNIQQITKTSPRDSPDDCKKSKKSIFCYFLRKVFCL